MLKQESVVITGSTSGIGPGMARAFAAQAHHLLHEEEIRKVILERRPTKKFVGIEQVAALAVFLAGDAGASMSIDAGWVAH